MLNSRSYYIRLDNDQANAIKLLAKKERRTWVQQIKALLDTAIEERRWRNLPTQLPEHPIFSVLAPKLD